MQFSSYSFLFFRIFSWAFPKMNKVGHLVPAFGWKNAYFGSVLCTSQISLPRSFSVSGTFLVRYSDIQCLVFKLFFWLKNKEHRLTNVDLPVQQDVLVVILPVRHFWNRHSLFGVRCSNRPAWHNFLRTDAREITTLVPRSQTCTFCPHRFRGTVLRAKRGRLPSSTKNSSKDVGKFPSRFQMLFSFLF